MRVTTYLIVILLHDGKSLLNKAIIQVDVVITICIRQANRDKTILHSKRCHKDFIVFKTHNEQEYQVRQHIAYLKLITIMKNTPDSSSKGTSMCAQSFLVFACFTACVHAHSLEGTLVGTGNRKQILR